jgi:hypothetical protein
VAGTAEGSEVRGRTIPAGGLRVSPGPRRSCGCRVHDPTPGDLPDQQVRSGNLTLTKGMGNHRGIAPTRHLWRYRRISCREFEGVFHPHLRPLPSRERILPGLSQKGARDFVPAGTLGVSPSSTSISPMSGGSRGLNKALIRAVNIHCRYGG